MIQRIQSLYLFAIVALAVCTVCFPVLEFINVKDALHYVMDYRGISLIQPDGKAVLQSTTWTQTAFAAVFGVIAGITIFSFKKRTKQIRLSMINFIFMIGYYVLFAMNVWPACNQLAADWHLRIAALFPLIAAILNYLAIAAIGKDEKLVKSLDRLR